MATNRPFIIIIAAALLCIGGKAPAEARSGHDYSPEAPLVVVANWDSPPFEFNDESGKPSGYHVELMERILDNLHVSYRLVMTDPEQGLRMLRQHEAGLMIALSSRFSGQPYIISRSIVSYYRLRMARYKGAKSLKSISYLSPTDTLFLCRTDPDVLDCLVQAGIRRPYNDATPQEALTRLDRGGKGYFVCDEDRMNWTIRKLALTHVEVEDIGIPDSELRFIGYDKALIDDIDREYARLEQAGEQVRIRDRWLHAGQERDNSSPWVLTLLVAAMFGGSMAFLLVRLSRSRVRKAYQHSLEVNLMMTHALHAGRLHVAVYDLQRHIIRNTHGNLLPADGMSSREFISRLHPDDRVGFLFENDKMKAGETSQYSMGLRWNAGTIDAPSWRYLRGNAIAEREGRKTCRIVYAMKDLTQEREDEETNREIGQKYMTMFYTNLIPMSFYDATGRFIDANEKMRQLYEGNEEGDRYLHDTNLFDTPTCRNDLKPGFRDPVHACHHMIYQNLQLDKYIEFSIRPIIDRDALLQFYILSARDVTRERQLYLQQQRHDAEIRQTYETIRNYEEQLSYLMENSGMYIFKSDLKTRKAITHLPNRVKVVETFEEYISRIDESEQELSHAVLEEAIREKKPFNIVNHFNRDLYTRQPGWYAISAIPRHDEQGELVGFFGIQRNITTLMEAQHRLKAEMRRAEESGRMKSAFLANMTHEIRTPLNAIIGFSDLLPTAETDKERSEFIRIIHENCDMLIRLINDILEASNMGMALTIKPKEVDMAKAFDDICQPLEQHVQAKGVAFVKDSPYDSYVTTLDPGRIQQVLTNFTTNAIKYTHEGHIKVGYHAERRTLRDGHDRRDGLYFYCEDTGAGIPKEQQGSVFDRFVKLNDFVQGTGLGLSICQAIAHRCNGHIGVASEGEGHGSTFWMWVPCDRIVTPDEPTTPTTQEPDSHAEK